MYFENIRERLRCREVGGSGEWGGVGVNKNLKMGG